MITGFIINAIYVLFYNIISILPDSGTGLPSGILEAVSTFGSITNAYNYWLPADELLVAVGVVLTFELTLMLVYAVLWLIRTIRG